MALCVRLFARFCIPHSPYTKSHGSFHFDFTRIGMHVSADGRKTAHQAGAGSTPSIGTNKLLGGIAAAGDSPDW